MQVLFTNWLGQLSLLVIVTLVMSGAHRLLKQHWPAGLLVIDVWPPLLIIFTHFLTMQATESSIVPYEMLSLMILGIGITVLEVLQRGEILYGRFFRLYWRTCDLITILVYLIALVSYIVAKVGP
ncbi:DUF3397 domain-containing protein [Lactiplantibacillus mudanjiangensis]|uniref:Uncharacterized protein n=1 Tax=Lactiplantibacillus mudanjiangensis TaxID=1296538 RepID=A0A660EBX4_9LACO|nr:DUF3397 domain-containing protein [Lactiplantibacillus mudanjiangensis]VDG20777.1 hypothetical protein MUDAN_BIHEEGNE_02387 [Lactiplantibacillus mudanjiangensis]VDG24470.1 hypothetical protein MUDAN_IGPPGNFN_02705 [Lactiplantibacillus mudanjiangensis]VDG30058.1 hypothetical protein MUDAN_MDHGFNIF_01613 [Lactiplantibacillus mudanjiangensis]VDG30545.1 hypothetical protein MUDAN_DOGOELCO_00045 [Lactiplantibacillus mudanjiangensis]